MLDGPELLMEYSIREVSLGSAQGLVVVPALPAGKNYSFVHRDASGVTWLDEIQALAAREPERWKPLDLFQQIRCAVRNEYGDLLSLSPDTVWIDVPAELQHSIVALPQLSPLS